MKRKELLCFQKTDTERVKSQENGEWRRQQMVQGMKILQRNFDLPHRSSA
jgi:hypothetical protein